MQDDMIHKWHKDNQIQYIREHDMTISQYRKEVVEEWSEEKTIKEMMKALNCPASVINKTKKVNLSRVYIEVLKLVEDEIMEYVDEEPQLKKELKNISKDDFRDDPEPLSRPG